MKESCRSWHSWEGAAQMFFKLIRKNSKRNRKENGLFFSSLVISIVAFYIILSLSSQDVMVFLKKMESDAVDRLFQIIPAFFVMTLVILFFLIYYASKFQLERRKHEFGVYLMMGMRRSKLFGMLLAEDIGSSLAALVTGLPIAILLSELISLITAKCVGLGIVGHQLTFSIQAIIITAVGFLVIKLVAFLILSGKISGQEIGALLVDTPEGTKKQFSAGVYAVSFVLGIICLAVAYSMAIGGISWTTLRKMSETILIGFVGMLLLFYGMRFFIDRLAKHSHGGASLRVFNFRQVQENVIRKSSTLSISSILILAALCCFGAGIVIAFSYGNEKGNIHIMDYTFENYEEDQKQGVENVKKLLTDNGLEQDFSDLFEVRVGHLIPVANGDYDVFDLSSVMSRVEQLPDSEDKDILLNNLEYESYPYLISLSGYNHVLELAGKEPLALSDDEAAVFKSLEFTSDSMNQNINDILADRPEVAYLDHKMYLTGKIQNTPFITDRAITLSFALIVPDEIFDKYTWDSTIYLNGVLDQSKVKGDNLLQSVMQMNDKLAQIDFAAKNIEYESYLKNMGRRMFYIVAASYITIYLAIIFLIIANTVIGVQFLMGQQKSGRRYKTLIRLGATYELLCRSARKQINWYFGMPVVVAGISSIFGVRAVLTLVSGMISNSIRDAMLLAAAMILLLCVVECIYMAFVKRSSNRYLLTLMVPEREE